MIILEGPDGAGKSTLMARLEQGLAEYGIHPGTHAGTPNRDRMWETTVARTYDAIGRDLDPNRPPLMWDRLFYSELVYAPIMDRHNAFGTRTNYVHRLIAYTGSPVIFCMPPLEVVQENCAKTKQHSWVADNVEQIYRRYTVVFGRYAGPNFYVWDYASDDDRQWPMLVDHMRAYINKRRTIA